MGLRPYSGGGKFGGVTADHASKQHCKESDDGSSKESILEEASCGLRTDAGWGCMLRSAQMMLAQTVRVHFHPEGLYSDGRRLRKRDTTEEQVRIASWFADFPNPDLSVHIPNSQTPSDDAVLRDDYHWYSLHQMVAAGLGLGVLPGEWYGPTTACHVLRELNELHCRHLEYKRHVDRHNDEKGMFRVHIATEGCIYLDVIDHLMTKDQESKVTSDEVSMDDPLRIPQPSAETKKEEWDTSLLLLLPLRLGIQSIPTEKYGGPLAKLMQFPQSVGMLGGTPRHALWFYGAADTPLSMNEEMNSEDNIGDWYGLDPHTTQSAPQGDLEKVTIPVCYDDATKGNRKVYRWKVNLSESYLRSLHIGAASHSNHDKAIPLSKLDPTLALGFYFANHDDFTSFRQSLHSLNAECKRNNLPCILSILDKSPNYEMDVGEVMKNMALNNKSCEDDIDGFSINSEEEVANEEEDDDDEYVMV